MFVFHRRRAFTAKHDTLINKEHRFGKFELVRNTITIELEIKEVNKVNRV